MLKKLSLRNFRSHRDTTLEFHPGVNVIVGLPNKGKTNIFRALQWLIFNRPAGGRVRSKHTNKAARVTLSVDDKDVSLVLGKGGKRYEIRDSNGNVDKYKAVGRTVPSVVSDLLAISEVNMQRQLDKPFMLSDGPPEVYRQLNRVTRLEKVDVWIKKLNSGILAKSRQIKSLEAQRSKKTEQLEGMSGLSRLKRSADTLVSESLVIDEQAGRIDALGKLISEIESVKYAVKRYKGIDELVEKVDLMARDQQELIGIEEKERGLSALIPRLKLLVAKVNELDGDISSTMQQVQQELLSQKKCPFCPVCTTPIKEHNLDLILGGTHGKQQSGTARRRVL